MWTHPTKKQGLHLHHSPETTINAGRFKGDRRGPLIHRKIITPRGLCKLANYPGESSLYLWRLIPEHWTKSGSVPAWPHFHIHVHIWSQMARMDTSQDPSTLLKPTMFISHHLPQICLPGLQHWDGKWLMSRWYFNFNTNMEHNIRTWPLSRRYT